MFMFMEALFTRIKLWELPRYPETSEYGKKMLHTQSSFITPPKNKWVKLKITVLNKINQTQKDKYLI